MTHQHAVVSQEQWLEDRRGLLNAEKELTRLRDAVNQKRLALPWVEVEKDYVFATVYGPKSLAELSMVGPNCSFSTSCFRQAGVRDARAAHSWPITPTA